MLSIKIVLFCNTMYIFKACHLKYFGYFQCHPQSYIKNISPVNASEMCIPACWRSPNPPKITDWINSINKIAEMEELVYSAKEITSKFIKIWSCWHHFTTTTEYSQLMTWLVAGKICLEPEEDKATPNPLPLHPWGLLLIVPSPLCTRVCTIITIGESWFPHPNLVKDTFTGQGSCSWWA